METKPQIKFSLLEKLEFYDDPEMKRFKKIFPKVHKEDIRPFVQFAVAELEGRTPPQTESWDWQGLPPQGLAIRKLLQTLHREGALSDREELMEYLLSINLPKPCCEELIATILPRDIFSNIPTSIRLRPTLISLQWKIDISFCQRNPQHFADIRTKVSTFHRRARILLLLGYSNGVKTALSLSPSALSSARCELARAVLSCAEVERRASQPVRLTEEEREALEERGESIQGAI